MGSPSIRAPFLLPAFAAAFVGVTLIVAIGLTGVKRRVA